MTLTEKGIELINGGSDQPGTDDFADVADINAGFRRIDSLLGVTLCTSLSKPSEPVKGQIIFETDLGLLSVYNVATNQWVVLSNPTANVPVGTILTYAGATPPTSYLFAEGDSLLKATYPALFAVIGTQYGSADATRFNAPNLKGRTVVGMDAGQAEFNVLGKTGGAKTHLLTINEIPSHQHAAPTGNGQAGTPYEVPIGTVSQQSNGFDYLGSAPTGFTGGGAAHNNLQPYAAMRFIIKF